MSEKMGVAFVGCAHPHLPPRRELLASEPDVRLVGCYDPDPKLAAMAQPPPPYGIWRFFGMPLNKVSGWYFNPDEVANGNGHFGGDNVGSPGV